MLTRRQIVLAAGASAAILTLAVCSSKANYEEAARSIWRHNSTKSPDGGALLRELVRYATLAPSSHNTQCWKFRIEQRAIVIEPDLSRRCHAVDPDNHHLFVSLGCAAENLAHAALANGLRAELVVEQKIKGSIVMNLAPTPAQASPLFQSIVDRQCTRADYDGKPLSVDEIRVLEQAGTGAGVRIILLTERPAIAGVLEYVVSGNSAQMKDAAFFSELKSWIRFNASQAVESGDGLFSRSTGNPSAPPWLGKHLMDLFFTENSENDKYARQMRSSAGIAVFVSGANDPAHWIEIGRCYERFALRVTALGVFAAWLSIGNSRPDVIVRFGRGPKMPPSLRRPIQAVLV